VSQEGTTRAGGSAEEHTVDPGGSGASRSKRSRGIRPRPSRKPKDPVTGEPVKRTEFSLAFGERLKKARVGPDEKNPRFEINEVTQIMSELTGIPWNRQTVNTYENGYAVPPVEKLLLLADLYHASLDYLVRGQEANEVHLEQVLDKLSDDLRYPMFAIYNNPDLGKAVLAISRLPENERQLALEIVTVLADLNEANISVLRNLATQLAGANRTP